MSARWLGLHNPERHRIDGSYSWCAFCAAPDVADCFPDDPCRCCLAAEVEALRATVARVRELVRPGRTTATLSIEVLKRALDGES
jgi:hypothetical protein